MYYVYWVSPPVRSIQKYLVDIQKKIHKFLMHANFWSFEIYPSVRLFSAVEALAITNLQEKWKM